ncbi:uncharacterized protein K460DRAFT_403519 [Cucurbitaria berberidis CBS 394.84]|uniref:Rhodopsin domain-containing protein n=1 Tax=Cucurbitaria berberidis CBS 394.84 TaxID=1168544 RepID=A0A9P4LBI4_9PLEO|nr:uncharacterized protein K460DRAFT_403519 [Cucurbitaria berberidis CBS 394.84]KAF1848224.1 hypothetical protein K460DRAFT_403519 [Cucurbitaria berberidis CBS 394.84]
MAGGFIHLDEKTISQWPEPNIIDPKSRTWLPAYSITLIVLTSVTVFGRILSQAKKRMHGFDIGDVLCVIGWIFSVFVTATVLVGIQHYGFDRHMWDVPRTLYNRAALIHWLSELAFILSTCFTKISVLFFFHQLKPSCTTGLKCVIYAFMVFTACGALADALVLVEQCQPITASWRVSTLTDADTRHCISKNIYYPVHGLLTCFSTTYTVMIPVLVLRHIPMTKFQRTGLKCISLVSLSVLGAGIARTVFLHRFAISANGDATWNGYNVFVCAQTECNLALICASLPFLQPLFAPRRPIPIIFDHPNGNDRRDLVMSRVGSFVNSSIKRLHSRNVDDANPLPPVAEIPEWEFDALRSPGGTIRPSIETTYERYTKGEFGPPVPPKDLGDWLEVYRQQHGQMVRGYPF